MALFVLLWPRLLATELAQQAGGATAPRLEIRGHCPESPRQGMGNGMERSCRTYSCAIDDATAERIKAIARERQWSINEVILHALRHGLGRAARIRHGGNCTTSPTCAGPGSRPEAAAFREAVSAFEQVDGKPDDLRRRQVAEVNRAQHARAAGSGDRRQVARLAEKAAPGQPAKAVASTKSGSTPRAAVREQRARRSQGLPRGRHEHRVVHAAAAGIDLPGLPRSRPRRRRRCERSACDQVACIVGGRQRARRGGHRASPGEQLASRALGRCSWAK